MNKTFKRVLAGTSVVAMLAMNAIYTVSAAGLDGTTLTTTENVNDFVIDSSATPFTASTTCTAVVNTVSKACAVTDTNTLTIANGGAIANDTVYSISFITDDNVFGAVVYNKGTANTVQVSARVVPTLTLTLANGTDGNQAIAFGVLAPGSFSEDDIGVTYATNAVNGLTITMTSAGLKDTSIDREIGVQSIAANTDTTATDYYKLSTAGGTAGVTFDTTDNAITAAGGRDMRNTQVIKNVATPAASATQMVTIGAQAAVDTEAGNYSDVLTFTATASF